MLKSSLYAARAWSPIGPASNHPSAPPKPPWP
jgi:hypothetical protein